MNCAISGTATTKDMANIKHRLTLLERGVAGMKREGAELFEDHARQQVAIDRLAERVNRIERRLELHGGHGWPPGFVGDSQQHPRRWLPAPLAGDGGVAGGAG
jgi:hypothetical protein